MDLLSECDEFHEAENFTQKEQQKKNPHNIFFFLNPHTTLANTDMHFYSLPVTHCGLKIRFGSKGELMHPTVSL